MASKELQALRGKTVPQMVEWYKPRLLARIGVRTVISNVFGQYADHRLVQAATDPGTRKDLIERYDFALNKGPGHDAKHLKYDERTGTYWIDYMADTGDGFANTFAMAYLLAKDELAVPGTATPLEAGDILILGGDQCYPQATRADYKSRLQEPFSWAFQVKEPTRKLFALPGNHDWYDGLNAFDSLFCASRDKMASEENKANVIGGWRCQQHRSYWSMKLPHNWWIWGTDIQFSKYLDISQVNYFEAVARGMQAGDNLIICMAEPSWLLAELQGADDDANLYKITKIAADRGVKVRAAIAGDWHHYNRYYDGDLDVHFITAGGGGAFMHPTHVLSNQISVRWPKINGEEIIDTDGRPLAPSDSQGQKYKIRLKNKAQGAGGVVSDVAEVVQDAIEPIREIATPGPPPPPKKKVLRRTDAVCYPPKTRSSLLGFRNLLFPYYNFQFALGIGLIYWLITWQFYAVAEQFDISSGKIDAVADFATWKATFAFMPLYLSSAVLVSMSLAAMIGAVFVFCYWYADAGEKPGLKRFLVKFSVGLAHTLAHISTMFALGFLFVLFNTTISRPVQNFVEEISLNDQRVPAFLRPYVRELLEPVSEERVRKQQELKRTEGAFSRAAPPTSAPGAEAPPRPTNKLTVRKIIGLFMYPLEMILVGGLVGGFVWGLYWVLTGFFLRMHAEEAFAALRIKDYKNFLRIKVEPHRLTIYPIGIDDMPRPRDWTAPTADMVLPNHNPKLVPIKDVAVRMIEDPIVIETGPRQTA